MKLTRPASFAVNPREAQPAELLAGLKAILDAALKEGDLQAATHALVALRKLRGCWDSRIDAAFRGNFAGVWLLHEHLKAHLGWIVAATA
ncbi:hypothetical protein [Roseateles sp. P5_E8]